MPIDRRFLRLATGKNVTDGKISFESGELPLTLCDSGCI